MSNIKEIQSKKLKRNNFLLDIISKAKVNIDKNEELVDMYIVYETKSGLCNVFGQTLVPIDLFHSIGSIEVLKQHLINLSCGVNEDE